MNKNMVKINGEALKALLENKTGQTIYQISRDHGYGSSILYNAIQRGYASPTIVNIAKSYGISLDEYKYIEPAPEPVIERGEPRQMSIADIQRDDLKALLKECFKELIEESEIRAVNDPITHSLRVFMRERPSL